MTPRAQRDIWHKIAMDNERAADKVVNKLFDKFELAAMHPEMCPARPDVAAAARLLIEGRYIAIYEPTPYGVVIVAVVHGMRDPAIWL
ncbi:type II toxin-antitoxin system RelE/ParE family toxin [Ensifer sp. SL37]|uniref:type II toxin-antitoxin system RelE/ParE family toxin n=1 Tax=Ensifer sp. SL37 TaxID=2995137 RepID=UPI0022745672|nr:type II toxin-antitoxin system RelE/ParE family toxin [Ensifer sp. SL37]MCY1740621.1 type II toxin-antitoxin system RelE/ParE family toxin [Ensifer sp. SL37]